jgi:hypothetical protein
MTGIQEPGNIQDYVHSVWGDTNSCMSPDDRATAVVSHVNEQLQTAGVPGVTWRFNAAHGTGAVFSFSDWTMELGESPYSMDVADNATTDQQAWQVSAVYHEARHAEQWFRMAQLRAGQGLSAEAIRDGMTIPLRIARLAKAAPLARGSMEALIAQGWFDSVYGAGAEARGVVLTEATSAAAARKVAQERNEKDPTPANAAALARAQARFDVAFAKYQNLPEENDAHAVGPQTGAGVTRGAPDPVVPGPAPDAGTPAAGALPADGATAIEPLGGALDGLLAEPSAGVLEPVRIAP